MPTGRSGVQTRPQKDGSEFVQSARLVVVLVLKVEEQMVAGSQDVRAVVRRGSHQVGVASDAAARGTGVASSSRLLTMRQHNEGSCG